MEEVVFDLTSMAWNEEVGFGLTGMAWKHTCRWLKWQGGVGGRSLML
jgi:hypothetical protein